MPIVKPFRKEGFSDKSTRLHYKYKDSAMPSLFFFTHISWAFSSCLTRINRSNAYCKVMLISSLKFFFAPHRSER